MSIYPFDISDKLWVLVRSVPEVSLQIYFTILDKIQNEIGPVQSTTLFSCDSLKQKVLCEKNKRQKKKKEMILQATMF